METLILQGFADESVRTRQAWRCMLYPMPRWRSVLHACVILAAGVPARAATPAFSNSVIAGILQTNLITETSGLAASLRNPGVLWLHNDSGDSARLFAIDATGRTLGIYTLTGASAVDWEDLALAADPVDGTNYLYVGDIGDNSATRSSIQVYRVPEPVVPTNQAGLVTNLAGVTAFTLNYPDGAHNAETLLADPWTGDLFIITKNDNPARIYRAPYPMTGAVNTLQFSNTLAFAIPVGGSVGASGRQILIKRYASVSYYERRPGQTIPDALTNTFATLPYTLEPQGETVAWEARERGYFTLSENARQTNYYYASADSDGDGLVDSEEAGLGTDLSDADSDDDLQTDAEEIVAGTQPTNTTSFFFTAIDFTGPSLQWLAHTNRIYDIERADLATAMAFVPHATGITFATEQVAVTNLPANETSRAYRIRVRMQ